MLAPFSPSCARRVSIAGILVLGWAIARPASAQIAPRILHEGLACIVAGQHAVIESLVEPADDLVTVKVYFRAELYPAFFYVEAVQSNDRYRAVLPRPTRDVSAVVYYLEAVDRAFNSVRTEEFRPRVVRDPADCEDSRQPAYIEAPPGITVGATAAGSNFPPGFLTEGIVGTITAAGRAAGTSAGTIIGIGAAAGAAAGVAILVGGGDAGTTTVPAGGGPTTSLPITTSIPPVTSVPVGTGPVVACFDTVPNPATIPVGETVRFDASCSQPRDQIASYIWDFNDGRDGREGRVVTRQYTSPGVFPAELVVTDIRGAQARVEKEVRVTETSGGPGGPGPGTPKVISISKGGPAAASVGVQFAYNITITNMGSSPASGITMTDTIPASLVINLVTFTPNADNCGQSANRVTCTAATLAPGASFTVTITVRPISAGSITNVAAVVTVSPSESSSASRSTAVALKALRAQEAEFVSEIQAESPGRIQASIELNGLGTSTTHGGGPSRLRMTPQPGPNVLAGYAAAANLEGALWKLDFSQTEGFVPGSIAVEAGEVVSAATHAVVFRLAGSETRIRFRFRMDP